MFTADYYEVWVLDVKLHAKTLNPVNFFIGFGRNLFIKSQKIELQASISSSIFVNMSPKLLFNIYIINIIEKLSLKISSEKQRICVCQIDLGHPA